MTLSTQVVLVNMFLKLMELFMQSTSHIQPPDISLKRNFTLKLVKKLVRKINE